MGVCRVNVCKIMTLSALFLTVSLTEYITFTPCLVHE